MYYPIHPPIRILQRFELIQIFSGESQPPAFTTNDELLADLDNEEKSLPSKSIKKEIRARIRTIYTVIHDAIRQSGGKTFTKSAIFLRDNTKEFQYVAIRCLR